MKILYTTDQLFLHGGIEKVLSQKANYLAEVFGDEVFILTTNQNGNQPCYQLSDKINIQDLEINYNVEKSYFHPQNLKKVPLHLSKLGKAIKFIKPDVLVSCSFGTDFFFLPFIRKEVPKIKEFHASRFFSSQQPSIKKKVIRKLGEMVEKKYDAIAVLNPDEKKYYNAGHVVVIPNPTEFDTGVSDLHSKKILAAGRISPVKNFGDLIDAFSKLSNDFPEWELHFFGEDYLGTRKLLQEKINHLAQQNQIFFKGVSSNLKREMQQYSIYGMTSETECFPMVLLEALSTGLPVVSYDSPTGPRHILTDNSDSFVVPYKNLDIFTEKLRQLMANQNLRKEMGGNAKINAQRFEISQIMRQWKFLFESLM